MTQTNSPSTLRTARYEPLLRHLSRLDRGQLAALRRSLGDDLPGQSVPWLEGVFLRSGLGQMQEARWQALAVVAGLYALIERPDAAAEPAPIPEHRDSFGHTFGRLYLAQDQRPSTEKRFLALLDADMDALPYALRQAVTLLKAADMKPDWVQLMDDVGGWDHDSAGDWIRRRWAKDFYRTAERQTHTDTDDDTAPIPTGTLAPQPDDTDEGDTL
ncbi:type I-E CRISPR-associated protein Cse2/CasB [Deinococcus arenicola]|uniref:Type I-E CRISPR-associated protein Cse2/CasB n=1 Tax=Deinococcus arenicola TaxID=2994950 RepID=A0ABU4DV08_9DEIO|nr:type I-E CRISPR-associated protein Cse2/CasB [Deinococcus sp. ZS9-10]MDV6376276.1 type I-E CRISPR-associated protein Cse2/CasB [Deinococcus sp. ZS9-10]